MVFASRMTKFPDYDSFEFITVIFPGLKEFRVELPKLERNKSTIYFNFYCTPDKGCAKGALKLYSGSIFYLI